MGSLLKSKAVDMESIQIENAMPVQANLEEGKDIALMPPPAPRAPKRLKTHSVSSPQVETGEGEEMAADLVGRVAGSTSTELTSELPLANSLPRMETMTVSREHYDNSSSAVGIDGKEMISSSEDGLTMIDNSEEENSSCFHPIFGTTSDSAFPFDQELQFETEDEARRISADGNETENSLDNLNDACGVSNVSEMCESKGAGDPDDIVAFHDARMEEEPEGDVVGDSKDNRPYSTQSFEPPFHHQSTNDELSSFDPGPTHYADALSSNSNPQALGNARIECNQSYSSITTNSTQNCKKEKRVKREYDAPPIKVSFRDIIGHGPAKLRLDEALLPLALPPDLAESVLTGIRAAPASILLHGPPGCGKTQLAKAVAGEAQAAFLTVGPSDILSKFVGESEASIRGLFREARRRARKMESNCAVVFFDEIDALGRSRDEGGNGSQSSSGGDNSSRRVLAELLIQMTKLSSDENNVDEEENENDNEEDGRSEDESCCGMREREVASYDERYSQDRDGSGRDESRLQLPPDDQIISNQGMNVSNEDTATGSSPRSISPTPSSSELEVNDDKQQGGSTTRSSIRDSNTKRQSKPRVIVVAATNRPEDCDPALLRRFAVRVLVGLPQKRDRKKIIKRLLSDVEHEITPSQLGDLALATEGWSGSDLESMTREAVMAPVRECLRAAAILKKKSTKVVQRSGAHSSQMHEQKSVEEANTATRETLLNSFRNLRPVSLQDFENGIAFFYGEQQESSLGFGQFSNSGKNAHSHYDSSSSDDED